MNAHTEPIDDFWTHDTHLFEGVFHYYSRDKSRPQPVRGKLHVSTERYFDKRDEIIPLSNPRQGQRTYCLLHPYVFEPKFSLTVRLYQLPKHYADQQEAIGETIGQAKQEGVREVVIGNGQAWYYQDDKTVILWECFLERFVRDLPLLDDPNMRSLWTGFERFLLDYFPQTMRIATPFSDPLFPAADYQQFLRLLGYEQGDKAAFVKLVR